MVITVTPYFYGINKIYDGTSNANIYSYILNGVNNIDISNVYITNYYVALYRNYNVGNYIFIDISGLILGGSAAYKYNLNSLMYTISGNIYPKALIIIGINKNYDGTNNAFISISGIVGSDSIICTSSYLNPYVGNNRIINVNLSNLISLNANNNLVYYYNFNNILNNTFYNNVTSIYDCSITLSGCLNLPQLFISSYTGITIAFWMKISIYTNNNYLFYFTNNTCSFYCRYNNGTLFFSLGLPVYQFYCSTNIFDNNLHHVVLSISNSSTPTILLYIDGTQQAITVNSGTITYPYFAVYTLATINYNPYSVSISGSLQDFRYYNQILSTFEILSLYNNVFSYYSTINNNNYQLPTITLTSNILSVFGYNGYIYSNISYGVALMSNESVAVLCGLGGGYLYYLTNNNGIWSNINIFNNTYLNYTGIKLSADGSRGVVTVYNNFIYFFTNTYNTLTQTLDNTIRYYNGVAMTSDGTRIVVIDNNYIYYATWNGTNYGVCIQTLDTITRNYSGIACSNDGSVIAYSVNSGYIYFAKWNGSNYSIGVQILDTTIYNSTSLLFSNDYTILYLTTNNNPSGSLWYSMWNNTNYSNFTSISSVIVPNNLNIYSSANCNNSLTIYLSTNSALNIFRINIPGYFINNLNQQLLINNNYIFTSPNTNASIFQRYLHNTYTSLSKVYNTNIQGQSIYTIIGIYPGDIVDISNIYLTNFATASVGINIPVYISNVCLIGPDYFNYVIDSSGITTGTIQPVPIIPIFTINKTYDMTTIVPIVYTLSGIFNTDLNYVTLNSSIYGYYNNYNAGSTMVNLYNIYLSGQMSNNYYLTISSSISVSGNIYPRYLYVTGNNKNYDRSLLATVSISNLVGNDTVVYFAQYDDFNVGSGKNIYVSISSNINTVYNINNTNLLYYFPFDKDTLDYSSGTGINKLSINNILIDDTTTKLSSGSFKNAGGNCYITNPLTWNTGGITVSMWLKFNTIGSGTWNWQFLWDWTTNLNNNNRLCVELGTSINFNLVLFSPTAGVTSATSGISITDTNWHHFVVIISSNTYTFYLDNIAVMTKTGTTYPPTTISQCMYITNGTYTNNNYININQFIIFNRILTSTEIGYLYNYPNLIAFTSVTSGLTTATFALQNKNYQLFNNLTSGNIFQRYLKATYSGLAKIYNANTQGQSTYTISGIYPGDIVDISNIYLTNFASINVGSNKLVYINNITLIGVNYYNYIIDSSGITSGNIYPKSVQIYGNNKNYDSTLVATLTISGLISNDMISYVANFNTKNAETTKLVTASISLSGSINYFIPKYNYNNLISNIIPSQGLLPSFLSTPSLITNIVTSSISSTSFNVSWSGGASTTPAVTPIMMSYIINGSPINPITSTIGTASFGSLSGQIWVLIIIATNAIGSVTGTTILSTPSAITDMSIFSITSTGFTTNWYGGISTYPTVTTSYLINNLLTIPTTSSVGTATFSSLTLTGSSWIIIIKAINDVGLVTGTAILTTPSEITNISLSTITSTGFIASWFGGSSICTIVTTSYKINGSSVTPITSSAGTATFGSLIESNWILTITATNAIGSVTGTATLTAPSAITYITISSITSTGFTTNWSGGTSIYPVVATSYTINGVPSIPVIFGTCIATFNSLIGSRWILIIMATNALGSTTSESTTINACYAPSAITNISPSSITNSSFTVSWLGGIAITPAAITTYTINGLSSTPIISNIGTASFNLLSGSCWMITIIATNANGSVSGTTIVRPSIITTISLIIGYGIGGIAYTNDGINWAYGLNITTNDCYGLTYGNNKYLAIFNGNYISTSINGINWTSATSNITPPLNSLTEGLASGNGVWVTVNSALSYYSISGITWNIIPFFQQNGCAPYSVTFANGMFQANTNCAYSMICYSTNGINWTPSLQQNNAVSNNIIKIIYGNNIWVAYGSAISTAQSIMPIWYSINGINWNLVTVSPVSLSSGSTSITCMAFGNNMFYSIGFNNNPIYSNDGVNWQLVPNWINNNLGSKSFLSIANLKWISNGNSPTGGYWIAGGTQNNNNYSILVYSTDGCIWVSSSPSALLINSSTPIFRNLTGFSNGSIISSNSITQTPFAPSPIINISSSSITSSGFVISWSGGTAITPVVVPVYTGQLLQLPSTGTTGASSLVLIGVSTTITGVTGTQSFMNGTYIVNDSGGFGSGGWQAYNCFNANEEGFHSPEPGPYIGANNSYEGLKSVVINGITIYCEWITIQFPYSFVLTSYTVTGRTGLIDRSPKDFLLAGSNDGITWNLLNSQSGIITLSNTFNVSNNKSYSYYLLSITKIIGISTGIVCNISEMLLYGDVYAPNGADITTYFTINGISVTPIIPIPGIAIFSSLTGSNWALIIIATNSVGSSTSTSFQITYYPNPIIVGYGPGGIGYTNDGINWISCFKNINGNNCVGIAYFNSNYLAIYNGYTALSADGINWNIKFNNSAATLLPSTGLAAGNGVWVYVYSNLGSYYSYDGITWKLITFFQTNGCYPTSVIYANGMFQTNTNSAYSMICYSTDGINWTSSLKQNGAVANSITRIVYGNNIWVAYGPAISATQLLMPIWYSNDGINWNLTAVTPVSLGSGSTSITCMAFGNGIFYSIGFNNYPIYSNDGINWQLVPNYLNNNLGSKGFTSIIDLKWINNGNSSTGGYWMAGGVQNNNNYPFIVYSADGCVWYNSPNAIYITTTYVFQNFNGFVNGITPSTSIIQVPFAPSTIMGISTSSITSSGFIISWFGGTAITPSVTMTYTINGIATTPSAFSAVTVSPIIPGMRTATFSSLTSSPWKVIIIATNAVGTSTITSTPITYANPIIVGYGTGGIGYTNDGINWISCFKNINGNNCTGITYFNGNYLAIYNGYTAFSSDGINWNIKFNNSAATLIPSTGLASGNGVWVYVYYNTGSYYSNDGITWKLITFFQTNGCYPTSVIYANGMFQTNTNSAYSMICYSTDGINWTSSLKQNSAVANSITRVVYGNNIWVAYGPAISATQLLMPIWYSNNGINWNLTAITPVPLGVNSTSITCMAFGNGIFYSIGFNNYPIYSNDGINWQLVPNYLNNNLGSKGFTSIIDLKWINNGNSSTGGYWMAGGVQNNNNYPFIVYSADGCVWYNSPSAIYITTTYVFPNFNGFVNGITPSTSIIQVPFAPSPMMGISTSSITSTSFTISWFGGVSITPSVTMTYTINGIAASPSAFSAVTVSPTLSGIRTATFSSLTSSPWIVIIIATNSIGTSTITSSPITYYSNPIVVGYGPGGIGYTNDGINWISCFKNINGNNCTGITYFNGNYLAIYNGYTAFSVDGIDWNIKFNNSAATLIPSIGLAAGNGVWVYVYYNTGSYYSYDGIKWTLISFFQVNTCYPSSVIYANGMFQTNTNSAYSMICYSTDGINWTSSLKQNSTVANSITRIIYGNNIWVAYGPVISASQLLMPIWYSNDGINWNLTAITPVSLGSGSTTITCMAFGNGIFYSIGFNNYPIYSNNGLNWQLVPNYLNNNLGSKGFTSIIDLKWINNGNSSTGGYWMAGGVQNNNNYPFIVYSADGCVWYNSPSAIYITTTYVFPNFNGFVNGITPNTSIIQVPFAPSPIMGISISSITSSGFIISWFGGAAITPNVSMFYTINGIAAIPSAFSAVIVSPTLSGIRTATFSSLTSSPWIVIITATNAVGTSTITSLPITYYTSSIIVGYGTGGIGYTNDGINWISCFKNINGNNCVGITYFNGNYLAIYNGYTAFSTDGINWNIKFNNSAATLIPSTGLAAGNGVWVYVYYNTGSYYSNDGITWKLITFFQTNVCYPSSVIYANGMFQTNTNSAYSMICYSTDGINWTSSLKQNSAVANSITRIVYGNNIWVAYGPAISATQLLMPIWYSNDGINWNLTAITPVSLGSGSTSITCMAFGNGIFYSIGFNNYPIYSNNGLNWQLVPNYLNNNLGSKGFTSIIDLKWINNGNSSTGGYWMAGGVQNNNNYPFIVYSADGCVWYNSPSAIYITTTYVFPNFNGFVNGITPSTSIIQVPFAPSPMMGISTSSITSSGFTISWFGGTAITPSVTMFYTINGVSVSPLAFNTVIVSPIIPDMRTATFSSLTNGPWIIIITATNAVGTSTITSLPITYYTSSIIVGYGPGGIGYTNDGINWISCFKNINGNNCVGITYFNGNYLAIYNGYSALSTDGINWNIKFNNSAATLIPSTGLAAGNGVWVYVYYNVGSYYSNDGITWKLITFFQTNGCYPTSVIYANGMFQTNTNSAYSMICYSTDGINWTSSLKQNSAVANSITRIIYGNNIWVAYGPAISTTQLLMPIWYSNNGINWNLTAVTPVSLGTGSTTITCIAFGNGIFLSSGFNNYPIYSNDGINWQFVSNYLTNNLGSKGFTSIIDLKWINNGNSSTGGYWMTGGVQNNNSYPLIVYSLSGCVWYNSPSVILTGSTTPIFQNLNGFTNGITPSISTIQVIDMPSPIVGISSSSITSSGFTISWSGGTSTTSVTTTFTINGATVIPTISNTGTSTFSSLIGLSWIIIIIATNTIGTSTSANFTITYNTNQIIVGYGPGGIAYTNDGINWLSCFKNINGYNCTGITYTNGKYLAIYYGYTANSIDGISWNTNTTNINASLTPATGLTSGNGIWLYVNSATSYYSISGITWSIIPFFQSNGCAATSVIFANGMFQTNTNCAYSMICYSTDGLNWTSSLKQNSAVANSITRIVYGNNIWVAYGPAISTSQLLMPIWYSNNGINWNLTAVTPVTLGTGSTSITCIAFGNGIFYSIGFNNYPIYSNDGINWQVLPNYLNNNLGSMAFGSIVDLKWINNRNSSTGGYWITGGSQTNNNYSIIVYSSDGCVWSRSYSSSNVVYISSTTPIFQNLNGFTNGITPSTSITQAPFAPSPIIGISTSSITSTGFTISWFGGVAITPSVTMSYTINGVSASPSAVTVSSTMPGISTATFSSLTGSSWIIIITATNTVGVACSVNTTITYNTNQIIVGYGPGAIAYTSDGINWISCFKNINGYNCVGITYSNGTYIAIYYGYTAFSTDGINWNIKFNNSTATLNPSTGLASGNGVWVYVYYTTSYYSNDGIIWKIIPFFQSNGCAATSVIFANGMFQANTNCAYSMICYSTDGINWTSSLKQNSTVANSITRIVYGNNIWVAYGSAISTSQLLMPIWYSNNGIIWNLTAVAPVTLGIGLTSITCIAFGNGIFYSPGFGNNPIYSNDGINWQVLPNYLNNNLGSKGFGSIVDLKWINNGNSSTGGYWVTGGSQTNNNYTIIVYSSDGCVWSSGSSSSNVNYFSGITPIFSNLNGFTNGITPSTSIIQVPFAPSPIMGISTSSITSSGFIIGWFGGAAITPNVTMSYTINGVSAVPSVVAVSSTLPGISTATFSSLTSNSWMIIMTATNTVGIARSVSTTITYNTNQIIVGYGPGGIAYTTDGINWIPSFNINGYNCVGITYSSGTYLAIYYRFIAFSTDGINWNIKLTNSAATLYPATGLASGNGVWVYVFNNVGSYYSNDGITWKLITFFQTNGCYPTSVMYANGMFQTNTNSGYSMICYSTDGINWTSSLKQNGAVSNSISRIIYGNNIWVAYGSAVSTTQLLMPIWYSNNGINWNLTTITPASLGIGSYSIACMAFGNGIFYSPGFGNNPIYSSDGINWQVLPNYLNNNLGSKGFGSIVDLKWITNGNSSTGGYWITGGSQTTNNYSIIIYSEDGCVWSGSPSIILTNNTTQIFQNLYGFTNGITPSASIIQVPFAPSPIMGISTSSITSSGFIISWFGGAAITPSVTMSYTINGVSTTPSVVAVSSTLPGISTATFSSLASNSWMVIITASNSVGIARGMGTITFNTNQLLVGYGPGGIAYTMDGINWIPCFNIAGYNCVGITYSSGTYLAIYYRFIAFSTDGINWNIKLTNSAATLYPATGLASGNGVWVYVFNNVGSYYSNDGITWKLITFFQTNGCYPTSVMYANGMFQTNTNSGYSMICYSTDGINWTSSLKQNGAVSNSISRIIYGNNIWVAYGSAVSTTQLLMPIWYSNNGINWNLTTVAPASLGIGSYNITCMAFGNGIFYSPGFGNNPIYSSDGINWQVLPNYLNNNLGSKGFGSIVDLKWINNGNSSTGGYWITGGSQTTNNYSIIVYSSDGCVWSGSPSIILTNNTTQIFQNLYGFTNGITPSASIIQVPFAPSPIMGISTSSITSSGFTISWFGGAAITPSVTMTYTINGVVVSPSTVTVSSTLPGISTATFSSLASNSWMVIITASNSVGIARSVSTTITYNANQILVGYGPGGIAYTIDGINWISCFKNINGSNCAGITYFNGKYLAIYYGYTALSTDGINWNIKLTNSAATLYPATGLASGNGVWVYVFNNVGSYYSNDGITWKLITFFQTNACYPTSVMYANGMFQTNTNSGYSMICYSTDGINWTSSLKQNGAVSNNISRIIYGNNIWVAYGSAVSTTQLLMPIWYSNNGINWNLTTVTPASLGAGSYNITCMAFGNSIFLSSGFNNSPIYSSDGINWQRMSNYLNNNLGSKGFTSISDLKWIININSPTGGYWVTGGPQSTNNYSIIVYSSDGCVWSGGSSSSNVILTNSTTPIFQNLTGFTN